jgi:hypothetical protein
MKNKRFYVIAFASAVIMLILASGVSAQSFFPLQGQLPSVSGSSDIEGVLSIAAIVADRISYQGVLSEVGQPVTGFRDMTFRLFTDDNCTTQVGADVDINDVVVTNGLFSVEVSVDPSDFNGQQLFLEVVVSSTRIACQEILPVPYALSLRPGAKIATESTDAYAAAVTGEVSSTSPGSWSAGLRGINNGTGATGIGVYGSQEGSGWGVYGQVMGNGMGVYGLAYGQTGVGVYAQGSGSTGTALMLSSGGIRVNGAGLGTSTPVFIHQATESNIMGTYDQNTMIDNPLTNGDPNAILSVTPNWNAVMIIDVVNNPHPVGVKYLDTPAKWVIYNLDLAAMPEGAAFNVLVVKP